MNPSYLNWIRLWNPETKTQDFLLDQYKCPSPLYMAVFLGFVDISEYLINSQSYINGTGGLVHTTLQLALHRDYIEVVEALVAAGEDVNKNAESQPTALYTAVENGNAELVKMLLAAGAKPDANHLAFGTALQLASLRGFTDIVKLLVSFKANVNLESGRFGTALQAAAAAGHSEIVGFLLKQGAKAGIISGFLGTAIQAAATGGHSEVVRILAAEDVDWGEDRDSIWHEAYDLWESQSSGIAATILSIQSFLSKKLPVGSNTQRMLAGILQELSSLPTASESKAPSFEAVRLSEQFRRNGQEGMESEHYVYRALFWAMMLRCTSANLPRGRYNLDQKSKESLERLYIIMIVRASDQNSIEFGTSDALMAVRKPLVVFYALAFRLVVFLQQTQTLNNSRSWRSAILAPKFSPKLLEEMLEEFERQNARLDPIMKIARQEPPMDAVLLDRMHCELLAKMQQEIRGCYQTLEEDIQKRFEEVGQRLVASVRDILSGVIREEMRKLLVEQKDSVGLDDRG